MSEIVVTGELIAIFDAINHCLDKILDYPDSKTIATVQLKDIIVYAEEALKKLEVL